MPTLLSKFFMLLVICILLILIAFLFVFSSPRWLEDEIVIDYVYDSNNGAKLYDMANNKTVILGLDYPRSVFSMSMLNKNAEWKNKYLQASGRQ